MCHNLYHQEIRATATTAQGTYEIEGTVRNLVPLRNRRTGPDGEELLTRISEGLTEWRCQGRTGHGLSEYLDQPVDGRTQRPATGLRRRDRDETIAQRCVAIWEEREPSKS